MKYLPYHLTRWMKADLKFTRGALEEIKSKNMSAKRCLNLATFHKLCSRVLTRRYINHYNLLWTVAEVEVRHSFLEPKLKKECKSSFSRIQYQTLTQLIDSRYTPRSNNSLLPTPPPRLNLTSPKTLWPFLSPTSKMYHKKKTHSYVNFIGQAKNLAARNRWHQETGWKLQCITIKPLPIFLL